MPSHTIAQFCLKKTCLAVKASGMEIPCHPEERGYWLEVRYVVPTSEMNGLPQFHQVTPKV
jgi:hypothetical protein